MAINIDALKKVWEYFGTLNAPIRERVKDFIFLEAEFMMTTDIERTRKLLINAGLTPRIRKNKISVVEKVPNSILDRVCI
jgi:hypothetical protein